MPDAEIQIFAFGPADALERTGRHFDDVLFPPHFCGHVRLLKEEWLRKKLTSLRYNYVYWGVILLMVSHINRVFFAVLTNLPEHPRRRHFLFESYTHVVRVAVLALACN